MRRFYQHLRPQITRSSESLSLSRMEASRSIDQELQPGMHRSIYQRVWGNHFAAKMCLKKCTILLQNDVATIRLRLCLWVRGDFWRRSRLHAWAYEKEVKLAASAACLVWPKHVLWLLQIVSSPALHWPPPSLPPSPLTPNLRAWESVGEKEEKGKEKKKKKKGKRGGSKSLRNYWKEVPHSEAAWHDDLLLRLAAAALVLLGWRPHHIILPQRSRVNNQPKHPKPENGETEPIRPQKSGLEFVWCFFRGRSRWSYEECKLFSGFVPCE